MPWCRVSSGKSGRDERRSGNKGTEREGSAELKGGQLPVLLSHTQETLGTLEILFLYPVCT